MEMNKVKQLKTLWILIMKPQIIEFFILRFASAL